MDIARKAFQFWTENSCLRWEEGCVGKPTIVISTDGRGCNTSPGRLFTSFGFRKRADGTADVVPDFADEQPMSLKAPGCSYFGTAAHEASHAMGMVHEQARLDRDNYIDIVKDNIANGWLQQYDKQQGSETYGIAYDYASNMQYTGYANDPKIDMAAKERIYQHTMGSRYGPIFSDLKFLNTYNDCMCKGGIVCANQGFPHPRHCDTKCVCPEGFGGATCAERQAGENGAPIDCGATLTATPSWQTVEVSVPKPAIPATKPQVALRQACCTWWIKGNGKRVELQLESVTPAQAYGCRNDCAWGGTEVKFGDLTRGGARVCCAEHAKEFGSVSTSTDMAIVRVCSMRSAYTTTVKFRTTG
ncbi:metalloprotease III [Aphelenchoides avenae]|nr:metalloprotease III [Aphelenchus avenae]